MRARPFTPTREDPRDLDARTVGVESGAAIDRIAARIDAAPTGNLAHTLVVGPRGAGKTHALAVAQQRSRALHAPGAAVAVVVPEDAHGIVTYAELLGAVARDLGLHVEVGGQRDVGQIEARVGEVLGDRVLVLVVENLDRLFAKLGRDGQHDLRAWVETSRRVLVLASTPMLFDGVQRRDGPWFGSFVVEPLGDLTAEDGTELLTRLRADDTELVPYLATESGMARVQALHALTGGSPRLWTIFADVVTVDLLDELVPAVERLLEELVTYYQQRLWDLGPNEERIVIALGTGAVSQTATALAHDLGLDRNTIGTTLGRLEEARWVRGGKVAGTDQRSTWYELREPLLRHYLQYRNESTSELTLVVTVLRHWFDLRTMEKHLTSVAPGSVAERYVVAALGRDGPPPYGDGFLIDDEVDRLLLQARRWITDAGSPAGFADAGRLIEGVWAKAGWAEVRPLPAALSALVAEVDVPGDLDDEGSVRRLLDDLARLGSGRVGLVLEWIAARMDTVFEVEDGAGLERLRSLAVGLDDADDPLALAVAHDIAHQTSLHDAKAGIVLLSEVVQRRSTAQGAVHPDTVLARRLLAGALWMEGRREAALSTFIEIAEDCTEQLGSDHAAARRARLDVAWYSTQVTGDAVSGLLAAVSIHDDLAAEPVFDDLLSDMVAELLGLCLAVIVAGAGAVPVPDEARRGLAGAMIDATDGSSIALAQIPIGLRPVIEDAHRRLRALDGDPAGEVPAEG